MWIQLLTSRLMKPERSLASSKTWAFFWSVLFLIQENVSNCSQFESTLQLLQDFFSHSLKISKNKSVTTSKPAICSKIRHFFFEYRIIRILFLLFYAEKERVRMDSVNHIHDHFCALCVYPVHLKP